MTPTLGIDPGASGGLALLGDGQARAFKLPETERDTVDLLRSLIVPGLHAYIERVSSSPQMGVRSAFTFGHGVGGLRMALIALGIPFESVTPQKWQKAMGCLTGGDKNVSKRRAQELYPALRITHATADALLIATYGLRLAGHRLPSEIPAPESEIPALTP